MAQDEGVPMVADPTRVAMISVHTSPLEQPGTGDAGGLNVYVAETATQLAARGIEVDIFTRRTTGETPVEAELVPGVRVRHVTAGPYEGLSKEDPIEVALRSDDLNGRGKLSNEGIIFDLDRDSRPLFTFKSAGYPPDWTTHIQVHVEEV